MLKGKLFTATLFSIWGLVAFAASALATEGTSPALDNPDVKPSAAVGSYTVNGTFHWILPGGDARVLNFSGKTRDEIFKQIRMLPEDEAKIVHQVPPSDEIIIDGVSYKPEDVHLFDGRQLGFIAGKDDRLYAFTTEEGFQAFKQQQLDSEETIRTAGILSVDSVYLTITTPGI